MKKCDSFNVDVLNIFANVIDGYYSNVQLTYNRLTARLKY
jgi:hypothetical protein